MFRELRGGVHPQPQPTAKKEVVGVVAHRVSLGTGTVGGKTNSNSTYEGINTETKSEPVYLFL